MQSLPPLKDLHFTVLSSREPFTFENLDGSGKVATYRGIWTGHNVCGAHLMVTQGPTSKEMELVLFNYVEPTKPMDTSPPMGDEFDYVEPTNPMDTSPLMGDEFDSIPEASSPSPRKKQRVENPSDARSGARVSPYHMDLGLPWTQQAKEIDRWIQELGWKPVSATWDREDNCCFNEDPELEQSAQMRGYTFGGSSRNRINLFVGSRTYHIYVEMSNLADFYCGRDYASFEYDLETRLYRSAMLLHHIMDLIRTATESLKRETGRHFAVPLPVRR